MCPIIGPSNSELMEGQVGEKRRSDVQIYYSNFQTENQTHGLKLINGGMYLIFFAASTCNKISQEFIL